MRARIIKVVRPTAIIVAIGLIYIVFRNLTGLSVPCPIHAVTGLYCPGCGVSRMFFHLARLEFAEAFSSNCVLFVLAPVFSGFLIFHIISYIRTGKKGFRRWEEILCIVLIGVLLAFMVLRNIFRIDILVP